MNTNKSLIVQNQTLLDLLGNGHFVHRREVAQHLSLSPRHVTRVIKQLKDSGWEIESDRRGYRLLGETAVTPVHLSPKEVCLFLMVTQAAAAQLRPPLRESWHRLAERLRHRLSPGSRQKVSQLSSAVQAPSPSPPGQPGNDVLTEIHQAITQRMQMRVSYRGLKDSQPRSRHIEPLCLFLAAAAWYLQGYDLESGKECSFRTDRIEEAHVLALPSERGITDPSTVGFHRWDLGEGGAHLVRIRVEASLRRWLEENPVHPSQKISADVLELSVTNLERVSDWVLSLRGATPLAPPELLRMLGERTKEWSKIIGDLPCPRGPVESQS